MAYEKRNLIKKSDNISDWYNRVVVEAKLADYGPSKGTMIILPYGYAIWELVQQEMDKQIKAYGVENAYFPLFIPESLLKKEKDHVEGFAPELAIVTIGGGKELEEKLVVRPTSETIMYDHYSKMVNSWRDLPILINQWNNVVRWEKRTYLFLRTTEFLWQEGHTAHATHKESLETVKWAMNMYAGIYKDLFAMAGYVGHKSPSEKFAGAVDTLTYESLMPDGKALQSCTSHDLGQNFSKPFNIKFQDQNGQTEYVWQTSWGFSTRALGGLILAHGDDNGLKLPPKLAPTQVIILPITADDNLVEFAKKLNSSLVSKGIRSKIDAREDETIGYRINKWEVKGAPIRIEIGKKELESNTITVAVRGESEKKTIKMEEAETFIAKTLTDLQTKMLQESEAFLKEHTHNVDSYDDFKKVMETTRGFIKAMWCENENCESKIKEETKATTRCLPLGTKEEKGKCIYCGSEAKHRWVFAQAY